MRLASAYAPPDSKADRRPAFFKTALAQLVNPNTILGIDSNYVLDETLDLKRIGRTPTTIKEPTNWQI